MNSGTITKFKAYFSSLESTNEDLLTEIYDNNIIFTDPVHSFTGLDRLKYYFHNLNANLLKGSFMFHDEAIAGDKAYLSWQMTVTFKKPARTLSASGISVLTIAEKVVNQRDYFDAGEMFYEHIPVMGGIIRKVKRKLSNV